MTEEIHDTSRVDAFMAARRRSMLMHAMWKPMLAGAVGAAIMSATVIGSVWVILPKISTREVTVDHVIQKDVPFDNHTPVEKPFDNYVPHDKPFDNHVPRDVKGPVAQNSTPPIASNPADVPKTPDEQKFHDKPEYQDAIYHGRIVASRDGRSISFADGQNFQPARWDPDTHTAVGDPNKAMDSDPYVGDLGMCVEEDHTNLWDCTAMHNGQEIPIPYKPTPHQPGDLTL